MASSRRSVLNLIDQSARQQPLNKVFLADFMSAIEKNDQEGRRKPSQWYKPSSFVCLRQMYFMRIGQPTDGSRTVYNGVGMADTGSRRHEAVQSVLMKMEDMGYDWRYIDVETYVAEQKEKGHCVNLDIVGKHGAETKLFDKVLKLSFMCDGIIQRISTGKYYLFEFKNQISFKYNNKQAVDPEHKHQVACYCMALNLSNVFVLYENRDSCELECPEVYTVTQEMKDAVASKIFECEGYIERLIPPPKHHDTKPCRWCDYKTSCEKAGN